MRKTAVVVLFFSLMCLAPSSVFARSFEFGPRLGVTFPTGSFADKADEGLAYGLYLGYYLNKSSFMELAYLGHGHSVAEATGFKSASNDLVNGLSTVEDSRVKMHEFTLSYEHLFFRGRFSPYVKGGVGAYLWNFDVEGVRTTEGSSTTTTTSSGPDGTTTTSQNSSSTGQDPVSRNQTFTDIGLCAGGGLRYMVTGELALGAELTYNYVFGDFDDGFFNLIGTFSYGF